MSNKFKAFMANNIEEIPNKKIVVSNRIKENGKPAEWEIRAISNAENDDLMRRATVNIPVQGQRGQYTRELDRVKYTNLLIAASVVYPDLNDAELQDSYGVKTPEALLSKMLKPFETAKLAEAVADMTASEDMDSLVEEAKN